MIAVEQSVEMPLEAIDDPFVNSEIVGRVLDIKDVGKTYSKCASRSRPQPSAAMPGS